MRSGARTVVASNIDRLRETLDELFMFDRADLDFGLYRIMNVRREEIRRFLDHDLLPKVREALGQMQEGERAAIQAEKDVLEQQLRDAGVDPGTSPKFRELSERYEAGGDTEADEAEVYGHLVSFFRRYYKEGDFISLRRYKEGVYAIPYEGEEVKLHWANADQYYIKTTEYFRDYTFLVSHEDEPERRVHFKLVEADTERNNNRAQAGNDRRFFLAAEDTVEEVGAELVVRVEYRRPEGDEERDQKKLNAVAAEAILGHPAAQAWRSALARDVRREGASEPLTLLRKYLNTYTDKNTFDYFIHKDLGGFLRRELDFYIKNEVLHLDDVDTPEATSATLAAALRKVKAIRAVGLPIIEFLASLEEFQKRLWLKKKFVVETHWCVTLDRVPRDLYAEVAANDRQRVEWVRLFAIDEIAGDMVTMGYSEPLTEAFLETNQHLVLDTSIFHRDFTERLLASIDDLDEATDGLLVHGENFQALNLLSERYREGIEATFVDPPYNTGSDGFPYKDEYLHSSWLSMFRDRVDLARSLMAHDGVLWTAIDENEISNLARVLDDSFGVERLPTVVWQHSVQGKGYQGSISLHHNYLVGARRSEESRLGLLQRTEQHNVNYSNPDDDPRGAWRAGDVRNALYRPNLIYDIETPSGKTISPPPNGWRWSRSTLQAKIDSGEIVFSQDETRIIRKIYLEDQEGRVPESIWFGDDVGTTRSANSELKGLFGEVPFPTAKPTGLVATAVSLVTEEQALILDYFAGSGTTGHAVINLNREDEGQRKYILVEMGEYFDTVLKPRVLKAVYSKDWKDGKPVGREGVSQLIKVIRLESYEDTLTNLRVERTQQQASLLDGRAGDQFRRDYSLRYWLTEETRGSASLLDLDRFEDPWSYTLEVGQGSAAETKPLTVDLVETFSYLLGLRVQHVDHIRGVTLVQGTLPPGPGKATGEKALVLWRNTREMDAEALDKFLWGQRINPRDLEFDVIYVNGDNHLENSRRSDETWKVRLIEDEFHRLMFETAEQERRQ